MLNKEKFKDEIVEIACKGCDFAFKKGKVYCCYETLCSECLFCPNNDHEMPCKKYKEIWANSEYEEYVDWSKVPVDTKILVRFNDGETWNRRYFAKYENGTVYSFADGHDSFTDDDCDNIVHWRYAKLYKED